MTAPDLSALLDRLAQVRARLAELAATPPPGGLTAPDAPTGERWEWGQVWAHVREFPSYWAAQVRAVLADASREPVPFGRVKTDAARLDAIERGRLMPPSELWLETQPALDDVAALIGGLTDAELRRLGVHRTLGVMDVERILEEFVVAHLEEHAEQLDSLLPPA